MLKTLPIEEVRYVIRHHPGLMTEIMIERRDGSLQQIETRYNWADARTYCCENLKHRGITPVIEKPEHYVETFNWIMI